MGFNDKIREKVKQRSHFKCCLCHEHWATEVHHIIPKKEGGKNDEENAAPLCATCHDLFGGNPEKRKFIKQARNFWYSFCEKRSSQDFEPILKAFERFNKDVATKEDVQNVVRQLDVRIQKIIEQPISTSEQLQKISDETAAFSYATSPIWHVCRSCGYPYDIHTHKMCPQCEVKCSALILAGGLSNRWRESIGKKKKQGEYTQLYWKNVVKKLKELRLGNELQDKDRSPPKYVEPHKSCAMLKRVPLLAFSFLNFMKWGINDITVVIHSQSHAYNEIRNKIDFGRAMGRYYKPDLNIDYVPVSGQSEIAHSVYEGFKRIRADERDTIVGYSDIVWERSLLKGLLDDKDGDIVILVDDDWEKHNYPATRIWHNKLFAELLFCEGDQINKICEAVIAFEIPHQYKLTNNIEPYEALFSERCGEIVGLFKFSQKGRKYFLKTYNDILKTTKKISMAPWPMPLGIYNNLHPRSNTIDIKKALLGNFLEFLVYDLRSKGRTDVKIKPLVVNGRDKWAEIDHWGDILLAEDKKVDYLALQK